MDLRMDYDRTVKLGIEKLFEFLQALVPHFNLYSLSTDWINSKDYIAKAKGAGGDVIIRWYK